MLMGEGGILKQATDAKDKHEKAQLDEQRLLGNMEAALNINGYTYTDFNEKTIKIPSGFAPTGKEGESTVAEGFVITDSQGNEYVWIEVPQTTEVYVKTGLGVTDFEENVTIGSQTKTNYEWIRDDLQRYTNSYRTEGDDYWYYQDGSTIVYTKDPLTGTNYKRTGSAGFSGTLTNPETIDELNTTGCGITYQEFATLYKAMLKGIYENGGFYIGRYEAGTRTPRSSNTGIEGEEAFSKKGLYPLNYLSCGDAVKLAIKVNSGEMKSSLMFGIQWILVEKYLETSGLSRSKITEDSTEWGNFYDSELELTNGKYKVHGVTQWKNYNEDTENYVENRIKHGSLKNIYLTTGASECCKKQNIYDLAGNYSEFTLEVSPWVNASCCWRGSYCSYSGAKFVNSRYCYNAGYSDVNIGFRVSIY